MYNFLFTIFLISGLVMIVLILLRKGEAESLGASFSGLGDMGSVLGVKAQKHLDKVITYISAVFIITGILLNTPKFRKVTKVSPKEPAKEAPTKEAPAKEAPSKAPAKDK